MRAMLSAPRAARAGIEARGSMTFMKRPNTQRRDVRGRHHGRRAGNLGKSGTFAPGEVILHLTVVGLGLARPMRTTPRRADCLRGLAPGRLFQTISLLPNIPSRRHGRRAGVLSRTYRGGQSAIALTGDSAGGNLALGLASRLTGDAAISATLVAVEALSPVTDLTLTGASYETRAEADPLFTARRSKIWSSPTWGAPTRETLWLRPFTAYSGLPPYGFRWVTTKCCWTTRFDMSSVQLPLCQCPC